MKTRNYNISYDMRHCAKIRKCLPRMGRRVRRIFVKAISVEYTYRRVLGEPPKMLADHLHTIYRRSMELPKRYKSFMNCNVSIDLELGCLDVWSSRYNAFYHSRSSYTLLEGAFLCSMWKSGSGLGGRLQWTLTFHRG